MNWLPKVSFLFEPADLWIGAFWQRKSRKLYVLPLPCLGIVLHWPRPEPIRLHSWRASLPAPTLIIAYNYAAGMEHARRFLKGADWRIVSEREHLFGYARVNLVKLDGWENRKTPAFIRAVRELEHRQNAGDSA